jgi:hypothetical protein
MGGTILTGQTRQLDMRHFGKNLFQINLVLVKFNEHPAREGAGMGMDTGEAFQTLDDLLRKARAAVQAPHRDACPLKPARLLFLDHRRGRWFLLRSLIDFMLSRFKGGMERLRVGGLWVKDNQDIVGEGIGLDPLYAADLAKAAFQRELPFARPGRQVDAQAARDSAESKRFIHRVAYAPGSL